MYICLVASAGRILEELDISDTSKTDLVKSPQRNLEQDHSGGSYLTAESRHQRAGLGKLFEKGCNSQRSGKS